MEENFEGEELDNIVILNDEEGNEVKFEFLDLVELDDEEYVVLLPVTEEGEEEEGEVVILKVEDTDDEDSDEESYISIEDEDILNKVFEIFKEKFKDDLGAEFGGIEPFNQAMEIILLFVVLACMLLIIKRKTVGALIYLAAYGMYFGTSLITGLTT